MVKFLLSIGVMFLIALAVGAAIVWWTENKPCAPDEHRESMSTDDSTVSQKTAKVCIPDCQIPTGGELTWKQTHICVNRTWVEK